jgi:hypothetical protein
LENGLCHDWDCLWWKFVEFERELGQGGGVSVMVVYVWIPGRNDVIRVLAVGVG